MSDERVMCSSQGPIQKGDTGPTLCDREADHSGEHRGINLDDLYPRSPRYWPNDGPGSSVTGEDA